MPEINKLSATNVVQAGDLFVVYVQTNGDARKAPVSVIQNYMQENLTFPVFEGQGAYKTQYSSPNIPGFDILIDDTFIEDSETFHGLNVHLILTPTGTLASGAITLPPVGTTIDRQEVLLNSTQQVTAFTVNANGATSVIGAPTSLAVNDFFRMKFDLPTKNWYRVG